MQLAGTMTSWQTNPITMTDNDDGLYTVTVELEDGTIANVEVQKVGYHIAGWAKTSFVFYCEGTYNASWHKSWNCRQGEEFHKVYYYSETYKVGAWHYVEGEPVLW